MTRRSAIAGGVLFVLALLIVAALAGRSSRRYGDAGTNDFIEYWGASRVAAAGGNPYDPAQLVAIEQEVGRPDAVPLMMWNPPWLLVLMRPVFRASFGQSATLWLGINAMLAVLSAILIAVGYRLTRFELSDLVPAFLGAAVSVPAVMSIQLGQVSLLLLLAAALLYWGLRTHRDLSAGVALALLSVKPHLFLLVVVLVAIVIWRERRWRILAGAAVAMALLLAGTMLLSHTLLVDWWHSLVAPPGGAPAPTSWRTPNLPNLVRELMATADGARPSWPLTLVPALAVALGGLGLWKVSRDRGIGALIPPVLCISVATAPFGWTFDHVVLAVPQVIVFVRALTEVERAARRWLLLGAVILCHVGLVVQSQLTGTDYFGFWWYPLAMLGAWWLSQRLANTSVSSGAKLR